MKEDPALAATVNPFRSALASITDVDARGVALAIPTDASSTTAPATDGTTSTTQAAASSSLPVSFRQLFKALTCLCEHPLGTSLLYTLMHTSRSFSDYVLTRSDVDELLMPCLKQVYHMQSLPHEHRYMLIITLLLFSQDAGWCENAHRRIRLPKASVAWFTDRILGADVSLGSFIVILLAKAVMSAPPPPFTAATAAAGASSGSAASTGTGFGSEPYLHSNCLAIVANMAPFAESLHPYAAQRLVALAHTMHRRYKRTVSREQAAQEHYRTLVESASASASEDAMRAAALAVEAARTAYEHFDNSLRIVCEAILACCAPSILPSNVHLLYTLLHERGTVVDPLAADPAFADSASGLVEVCDHFGKLLADEEAKRTGKPAALAASGSNATTPAGSDAAAASTPASTGAAASATATTGSTAAATTGTPATASSSSSSVIWEEEEVVELLTREARRWQGGAVCTAASESLRDEKFAYEEDTRPELFFVPYVWSLVMAFTSDCAWLALPASPIKLLQPSAAQIYVAPTPVSAAVGGGAGPSASPSASGAKPAGGAAASS